MAAEVNHWIKRQGIQVGTAKVENKAPTISRGWMPEEEIVLERCMEKYGVGNYKKLVEKRKLPGKNTQQLSKRQQALLGKQSIMEYHGLNVIASEIR